MEKCVAPAKELKRIKAAILSSRDIFFDSRALLKCRWVMGAGGGEFSVDRFWVF